MTTTNLEHRATAPKLGNHPAPGHEQQSPRLGVQGSVHSGTAALHPTWPPPRTGAHLVFRDVDEQLLLQELLQHVLRCHVHQGLLGGGRHALLHHDQRPRDVLLLHALAVHLDGLDAHLGLLCGHIAPSSCPLPETTTALLVVSGVSICQGKSEQPGALNGAGQEEAAQYPDLVPSAALRFGDVVLSAWQPQGRRGDRSCVYMGLTSAPQTDWGALEHQDPKVQNQAHMTMHAWFANCWVSDSLLPTI